VSRDRAADARRRGSRGPRDGWRQRVVDVAQANDSTYDGVVAIGSACHRGKDNCSAAGAARRAPSPDAIGARHAEVVSQRAPDDCDESDLAIADNGSAAREAFRRNNRSRIGGAGVNPERRDELLRSLLSDGSPAAVQLYLQQVMSPATRAAALNAIGAFGAMPVDELLRRLNDPLVDVRLAAARTLGRIDGPVLTARLADMAPATRTAARR